MNVKAANKIAAELADVQEAWEILANDTDGMPTEAQAAKLEELADRERELREALRDARANNSTGHTARLISENRD